MVIGDILQTYHPTPAASAHSKVAFSLDGLGADRFLQFTLVSHADYEDTVTFPDEAARLAHLISSFEQPDNTAGWNKMTAMELVTSFTGSAPSLNTTLAAALFSMASMYANGRLS